MNNFGAAVTSTDILFLDRIGATTVGREGPSIRSSSISAIFVSILSVIIGLTEDFNFLVLSPIIGFVSCSTTSSTTNGRPTGRGSAALFMSSAIMTV